VSKTCQRHHYQPFQCGPVTAAGPASVCVDVRVCHISADGKVTVMVMYYIIALVMYYIAVVLSEKIDKHST